MSATFVPTPMARPPVVEAIYGLQGVTPDDLDPEAATTRLNAVLPEGFSVEQSVDHVNIQFKREGTGPIQHQHTQAWSGTKLVSNDGKIHAHLMRFGLFINFLAYKSFEDALPLVQRIWSTYQEVFKPVLVSRISIRYINVLRLPFEEGRVDLSRYFQVHLSFPEELTNTMEHFHQQFVIRDPETNIPARVMISNIKEEGDHLHVAFDNEGYSEGQWAPEEQRIWDEFESVRNWTYHIFRTTLTEECLKSSNA